jgi:hypothetical protein
VADRVDPLTADWIVLPVRARDMGAMATQLLDAADRLGVPRWRIRTQSEGFKVPREVAADLFPSLFQIGG